MRDKLQKECRKLGDEDLPDNNDRTKYVRRILEIVASISKQNEEILRTASGIKKLQHEVDSLTSNLDRTFTVVNRWLGEVSALSMHDGNKIAIIFKQSIGDTNMQKAHKLLKRMHEQWYHCS